MSPAPGNSRAYVLMKMNIPGQTQCVIEKRETNQRDMIVEGGHVGRGEFGGWKGVRAGQV